MATIGSLNISVSADTGPLAAGLKKASGTVEGFAAEVKGKASAISGPFLAASGAIAAGFAAIGAGAFLRKAIESGANLAETYSKVDQVFGEAAGNVRATADDLAAQFGVVKQVTLDAASNIGLIAKASGLTDTASAELGSTFARLAADASSFYNVPVDVALEKIRAGLIGEAEPIRSFGVLLNEASVQAEALRLGIARSNEKLTDAQKVQARASLITRGLAVASGDLARTQDSVSNQWRKLQGDLENFAAEVGTSLLPPTKELLGLTNDLAAGFKSAFGTSPIKAFGEELTNVVKAVRIYKEIIPATQGQSILGDFGNSLELISGTRLLRGALGIVSPNLVQQAAEKIEAPNRLARPAAAARPIAKPMEDLVAATTKAADEAKRLEKIHEELASKARGIFEATRTPLEQFQVKVGELRQLLGEKLIDPDTFQRAFKAAQDELNRPQAEAAKQAREDLESQARAVKESIQTPAEKLEAERKRLGALLSAGLINPAEMGKALDAARKEIGGPGLTDTGPKLAGALELGSTEARSAVLASRTGASGDPLNRLAKTNADQLAAQREMVGQLRKLNTRAGTGPKVLSLPG